MKYNQRLRQKRKTFKKIHQKFWKFKENKKIFVVIESQ